MPWRPTALNNELSVDLAGLYGADVPLVAYFYQPCDPGL